MKWRQEIFLGTCFMLLISFSNHGFLSLCLSKCGSPTSESHGELVKNARCCSAPTENISVMPMYAEL